MGGSTEIVLRFFYSAELERLLRTALDGQPCSVRREGFILKLYVEGPLTINLTPELFRQAGLTGNEEQIELLASAIATEAGRYDELTCHLYRDREEGGYRVLIVPREKERIITVRLPLSLFLRLEDYCRRRGIDRSTAVREALLEYLEAGGDG